MDKKEAKLQAKGKAHKDLFASLIELFNETNAISEIRSGRYIQMFTRGRAEWRDNVDLMRDLNTRSERSLDKN